MARKKQAVSQAEDSNLEARLVAGSSTDAEQQIELSLRPQWLREYIGQKKVKDNLGIFIKAARARGEALDHMLLNGPPGLGKCITADSVILTAQGLVPFQTLIPADLSPDTSQPREVMVYGLNGLEIASHIYANGLGPTRRILTHSGFEIEGTPNHPLLVATATGPQWKRLAELSPDDYVAITRGANVWGQSQSTTWMPDLAYLLGVLVGDGHFERRVNHPAFIITCGEPEMAEELQRISRKHFGSAPELRRYGAQTPRLRFSQNYGKVMLAFGAKAVTAPDKVVPAAVLTGPREVAVGFLQGLFDSDGNVWPDGYVEFSTRSEALCRQAQLLLANLGIIARRKRQQVADADQWRLFIGGEDAVRFHEQVGFRLPRKRARAQGLQNRPRGWSQSEQVPLIYWDRVASITESTAETFDFVVPGSHSFVANGFFNHNTTLALVTAREMGANARATAGPVIEKPGDLAAILTNLEEGDVLFIDEIHRLHPAIEEILYPAMEDFELDLVIGQGPSARSVKLDLPRFTLIGATTRAGLISAPLRGRFGINFHLDFYPFEDLQIIVTRSAAILGARIDEAGAQAIARRSRGTPRIANRLLRRVRDYAEVDYDGQITAEVATDALNRMEVDRYGLDEVDRKLLTTIIEKFGGGPVGVGTISAAINEEKEAIEEIYEPYLIQIGFLNRTPRGRVVTPAAYQHLGLEEQGRGPEAQRGLFEST